MYIWRGWKKNYIRSFLKWYTTTIQHTANPWWKINHFLSLHLYAIFPSQREKQIFNVINNMLKWKRAAQEGWERRTSTDSFHLSLNDGRRERPWPMSMIPRTCKVKKTWTAFVEFKERKNECKKTKLRRDIALPSITPFVLSTCTPDPVDEQQWLWPWPPLVHQPNEPWLGVLRPRGLVRTKLWRAWLLRSTFSVTVPW